MILMGFGSLNAQDLPYPDRHSTSITDQWLSCTAAANPNLGRGSGHWLRIDLGDTYVLQNSKVWNFNTPERINSYENVSNFVTLPGKLTDGIKEAYVDLSLDGINWVEWGRFSIVRADGLSTYEGQAGPNFNGALARHILITPISNHGGTCYGLGEFKVNATIATTSDLNELSTTVLKAEPNPFASTTLITISDIPDGEAIISIKDISGREITRQSINVSGGETQYTFDGREITSGLYLATLITKSGSKSIKIELIK
jgi:hypothetical protein